MNEHTTKTDIKVIRIIFVVFVLLNILPIIFASAFTTELADDFSYANAVGGSSIEDFSQFLRAAFAQTKSFYLYWGGIMFSFINSTLFSPLCPFFEGQTYHWFMVFNAVFICTTFLFFIIVYWEYLTRKTPLYHWIPLFMAACGIYMFVNYDVHEEIFFWLISAVSYSIPLACLFLSLALFIRFRQNRKIICFITSCFLGFISMGEKPTVAGMGCYICLLFCFYEFLKNRRIEKNSSILFLVMLAGALFNVLAPGNYVRHSVLDNSGLHPLSAVKYAFVMCIDRLRWYGGQTNFLGILSLILLAGFILGKQKKITGAYIFSSMAGLLLPVVTVFPLALGYSSSNIPDRCLFLLDAAIILSFSNAACVIGALASGKPVTQERWNVIRTRIAFGAVVLICITNSAPQNTISYQVFQELRQGTYQNYYKECHELFEYLKTQKGKDVILTKEQLPQQIPLYQNFSLLKDPSWWINRDVSQYFGIASLSYDPESSDPRQ